MNPTNDVSRANSTSSEMDEKHKVDVHDEEIAVARLTEEDLYRLPQDSLSFKGKAAFGITLIMIVMGRNQAGKSILYLGRLPVVPGPWLTIRAGYGVDWAVISGINAFEQWHDCFGFGTSGSTFGIITALMTIGIITALMTIGNFCGSYFLAL
jgi:hypothetical protein